MVLLQQLPNANAKTGIPSRLFIYLLNSSSNNIFFLCQLSELFS